MMDHGRGMHQGMMYPGERPAPPSFPCRRSFVFLQSPLYISTTQGLLPFSRSPRSPTVGGMDAGGHAGPAEGDMGGGHRMHPQQMQQMMDYGGMHQVCRLRQSLPTSSFSTAHAAIPPPVPPALSFSINSSRATPQWHSSKACGTSAHSTLHILTTAPLGVVGLGRSGGWGGLPSVASGSFRCNGRSFPSTAAKIDGH